jgi:hypothetical protein
VRQGKNSNSADVLKIAGRGGWSAGVSQIFGWVCPNGYNIDLATRFCHEKKRRMNFYNYLCGLGAILNIPS